jgi:hypothetical protein
VENGLPKKFTACGKTFFDVSIIRYKTIYKWIYVLALPDFNANYNGNLESETNFDPSQLITVPGYNSKAKDQVFL